MFALSRKPLSPSTDAPAPQRPTVQRRERTHAANPLWLKLATSPGALQRKPAVSSPTDAHEREADAVADRVVRSAEPETIGAGPATVARKSEMEEEEEKTVQRKGRDSGNGKASLDVGGAVRAAAQGGEPLPVAARSFFEPRLGQDLGSVRVHTDGPAAEAARGVEAQAFTVGEHVVFGEGRYAPDTPSGKHLIAHELTHVLQQRAGEQGRVQRKGEEKTEKEGTSLWAKGPHGEDLPPSIDDIDQGNVDDCYLFAAMGAIVHTNPQKIFDIIKDNKNGTYTVTFAGMGIFSAAQQTVTADFVVGKHGGSGKRGAFWPLIIEKAYAQEKGGIEDIEQGDAGSAVDDLINVSKSTFDPRDETADYIMGKLQAAKEHKWPVTLGTLEEEDATTKKREIAGGASMHFDHTYVFLEVDPKTKKIKLYNPWGHDDPGTNGWVDVEIIRKVCDTIHINDDD